MRNKYYIFHTSCDYVDSICSLIKFVGGSVYTIITNREIPEGSINHCRVYCRLSWSQMMRLKRRLKDGKNKFIELSCYKRVNKFVYKLSWRRIIPHSHYTSQASVRSNRISDTTFDDILGKETEKLCQLEK